MAPMGNQPLFAQATLGRSRGPELFFQQSFTALAQNQIPKPLNLARPLEALIFNWRGRVVIGTANYTTVAAEAPQTIISRIRITGTYKGQFLVPVDITGATLFALSRLSEVKGNEGFIGTTLQPELTSPLAQVGATFGNTGTYDLDYYYILPMAPIISLANRRWDLPRYFWQSKDWADSIQIQIFFGDQSSFGTPGGSTTVTFSAFGSGAGSPTCNVFTCYSLLGQYRSNFKTACVLRAEQPVPAVVTALANALRLTPLQKMITTTVMLKSGLSLAGTSAGVSVFASLSDTIMDVTQVMNDNNPVRNNQDNRVFKAWMARQFQTVVPQGYFTQSFIDSSSTRTAFRADPAAGVVAGGADFALYSNIVSANAANLINFIQEMIVRETPDPYWDGTR